MKIGLFGGSFDPIHHGHLLAARDALEGAGLDQVVFIPAAQAPLRDRPTSTAGEHRLAMVHAAIEGIECFSVSDIDLSRQGTSFTIDTVREIAALNSAAELFWILGADQVGRLHLWREIDELARRATFIALERPGYDAQLSDSLVDLRLLRVRSHHLDFSSTEIRERAAKGLSLDFLLPNKAIDYLRKNGLYQATQ